MSAERDEEGSEQGILNIPQGEMLALDRKDGFFIVKSGSLTLLKLSLIHI